MEGAFLVDSFFFIYLLLSYRRHFLLRRGLSVSLFENHLLASVAQ